MTSILRKLVTELSFRVDKTGIGNYEKSINSLRKNVYQLDLSFQNLKFAMRGVLFGNVVLSGLALGVAKTVTSLDELSNKVGLSIGNIKALELISQKTGNSYGELTKTMSSFADKVSKIQNPIIRLNTLQSLMIEKNKKLANVFNQSTDGFKKSIAEVAFLTNVFTPKNIEDSKQYIKNWSEFRTILDEVRTQIGFSYMPVFNKLTISFKNWYLENKEFIQNISNLLTNTLGKSLLLAGAIIDKITFPIKNTINALMDWDKTTGVLTNTIDGFTLSLEYLIPVLLPISRLAKVISVSFLFLFDVIKDITGWINGLDSVSEKFFGKWENYAKNFQNFSSMFKESLNNLVNFSTKNLFPNLNNTTFTDPDLPKFLSKPTLSKSSVNTNANEPFFYNKNKLDSKNNNKNINLAPNFSIKIDNISVGDNVSQDKAESTAIKISEMISKEIDTSLKSMFSHLTNNVTS